MDPQELIEAYKRLLEEVKRLTFENRQLKAALGLKEASVFQSKTVVSEDEPNPESHAHVNKFSDSLSKIYLFMSLFKGRTDVYAKRWENPKKDTAGYSPVCLNLWKPGICGKPKILLPGGAEILAALQTAQSEFDTARVAYETERAREGNEANATEIKKEVLTLINDKLVLYLRGMEAVDEAAYGEFARTVATIIADNNVVVKKRFAKEPGE